MADRREIRRLIDQLSAVVTPFADAAGNPSAVAPGELIESAWGNQVQERIVRIFDTLAQRDAAVAIEGQLCHVHETDLLYEYQSFGGSGTVWGPVRAGGLVSIPSGSNTLVFSWANAVGTWPFGGDAITFYVDGDPVVAIDAAGRILHSFTGTSGVVKTFVVPHPVDDDRYLIHACLEGPTADVFYRGNAELTGERMLVDLPDYFEALTVPGTATVQLTPIGVPARLAASLPYGNRFEVVGDPCEFSWHVIATRAGTEFDPEPACDAVTVHGDGPYTWVAP